MAEKIVALLDDPAKRRETGAFGRSRVRNQLEWAYVAPNFLRAYEALFQDSRTGPMLPT